MARILVTGGAGFIGSHVSEALLDRGHEVTIVDNFEPYYSPEIKRRNLRTILQSPAAQFCEKDIRDEAALNALFAAIRPDAVIHLAARAGVRDSIVDPKLYAGINVSGTLNILEAMRQYEVPRLVFASSSSLYGGGKAVPHTG